MAYTSTEYWERRYKNGGGSGTGSTGSLASYKASKVNALISVHGVRSLADFGCGDGTIQELIRCNMYIGLDVSESAIERCRGQRPDRAFSLYDPWSFNPEDLQVEMTLSLDTLYHIFEKGLYDLHLEHLFTCAKRMVVIYSTDGTLRASGNQSTKDALPFTEDVSKRFPDFRLLGGGPDPNPYYPKYTGAQFYIYERALQ